jgi:hypothetical protein
MGEVDAMLERLQALPGGPAHGEAIPMRGHLHQAYGRGAGEDFDPPGYPLKAGHLVASTC